MKTATAFDTSALRNAIREEYTEVANNPYKGFHFLSGPALAQMLGYTEDLLFKIPETAIESFAGVGNPFRMGLPEEGQTVVDIGCGAGMDALIAARLVGQTGVVVGIDMTFAMIQKARRNVWLSWIFNAQFIQAHAESLPLAGNYADMVISNGVINLCPDKQAVFDEIYRVLRPGGRLQIADVLLKRPVSEQSKDHVHLWTTCVAGGLLREEYEQILRTAGFRNIRIMDAYDVFRDAPVASSAASFEAKGYNIYAEK